MDQLASRPLFVMKLNVAYDRVQNVGPSPDGHRLIYPVDGGTFLGEKLSGRVLPDGADWVRWRSDGVMIIDVRLVLETDDGARIGMTYQGLTTAEPEVMARFKRRELIAYEDHYVRTAPRFETSDPRYEWLNRRLAIANGMRTEEGPVYHVFEIL